MRIDSLGSEKCIPRAYHWNLTVFVFFQYGLYSAFAGCLVYCLFGSCKDITIGPTALMSLMTYQQVVGRNADFAVLLCFLTGIIQWLMGFFHLGL